MCIRDRPTTDSQVSWDSVLTALEDLSLAHNLGFKETFSENTLDEVFSVYEGTDRSVEGADDFVGYLGDDIGNVSNIKIVDSDANWKNVAVVAGEGEGAEDVYKRQAQAVLTAQRKTLG